MNRANIKKIIIMAAQLVLIDNALYKLIVWRNISKM